MIRQLISCVLFVVALSATAAAGDHYHFPGHVYAVPHVVYAAPVVAYQPAYVVPTSFVTVQSYPFGPVTYSTQYFAPLVPTVASYAVVPAVVPAYYAAPTAIVTPAVYPVPVYYGRGFRHHRHGVTRIEYERDGDIEIRHRY